MLTLWRSILVITLGFALAFHFALWGGVFDMGDPTLSLAFDFGRSTIIALWYNPPFLDRPLGDGASSRCS